MHPFTYVLLHVGSKNDIMIMFFGTYSKTETFTACIEPKITSGVTYTILSRFDVGLNLSKEKLMIKNIGEIKGTVSRDFLLLVFFFNQFPPSL